MLGDTAVAVHPKDPRYQHLIGKMVTNPLVKRDIPIIADGELVDPTLGTGADKVTPALLIPTIIAAACATRCGCFTYSIPTGPSTAMAAHTKSPADRLKARDKVTEDMEKLGLFDGREDRDIELKHSDRSKSPIEPYLSDQWFVRMADAADGSPGLAQRAMDAVTSGATRFFPERHMRRLISIGSAKSATGASAGNCGGGTAFPSGTCGALGSAAKKHSIIAAMSTGTWTRIIHSTSCVLSRTSTLKHPRLARWA